MGFQSYKNPNFGNFEIPNLGVLGQNDIWVHAPSLCTKNTIMGKVVAYPSLGCAEYYGYVFDQLLFIINWLGWELWNTNWIS